MRKALTVVILSVVLYNEADAKMLCNNEQIPSCTERVSSPTNAKGPIIQMGTLETLMDTAHSSINTQASRGHYVPHTIGKPQKGHYWIDPAPTRCFLRTETLHKTPAISAGVIFITKERKVR